MELHFDLFFEVLVILLEDLDHVRTGEFRRKLGAFRQGLSYHSTGKKKSVFLTVGAGPHGGHAAALVAMKGPVDIQVLALEPALGDLVEDLLSIKRPIVIANARMVTPDDHVAASVVLAEGGMQQGLSRSGIPHLHGITDLNHGVLDKPVVH